MKMRTIKIRILSERPLSISTTTRQDAKWREDAGHALHKSIFCLLSVGAFLTDRFNLLDLGFPLHAPNI